MKREPHADTGDSSADFTEGRESNSGHDPMSRRDSGTRLRSDGPGCPGAVRREIEAPPRGSDAAPVVPVENLVVDDLGGKKRSESLPVVVGIGASAGGLEAIQEFFNHMGGDSGAAFVVVQHLSPDFKSLMDEILRRHTGMSVVKVQDRVALAPNCVYLLPPRSNIVIDNGFLDLEQQGKIGSVPRPIDEFLCSLARERGEAAIAIILSGSGSDGARGVREVKDAGGTVLVQDPATARFDGMPGAAIATGCTDFVMSPRDLAERVTALLAHPYLRQAALGFEGEPPDGEPYDAILDTLKARLDCDLRAYKPGTLVRRIERRMSLHHLNDPNDYLALLQEDVEEGARLARDCLINVTHFFRDPLAFQSLNIQLTQKLLETADHKGPFRVWVAGCASGEEAYSIAALLQNILDEHGVRREFKVFATDIADSVLETASAGRFPDSIADEVPASYLEMLGATKRDGELRISPALRNRIVFAKHDVLRDPPFPRADLVTCRNLLIYFKPEAQRAALERFLFSLNPRGLLFLGASESIELLADDFETIDTKHRIYTKKSSSRRLPTFRHSPGQIRLRTDDPPANRAHAPLQDTAIVRGVESMVRAFARAGVIVDDAGRVLYSFGDVAGWLNVPRGRVSTNLFDMLPENAVDATRWALRQARHSQEPVCIGKIVIQDEDCSVDLLNVPADEGLPGLDVILLRSQNEVAPPSASATNPEIDDVDTAVRQQIESLEKDLQSTRESLQTTIEELETANEELQSTNEELLASNEELQSTNEELHSVNEELYTVNAEHEQKIAELTEVTADLEHLLNTTAIGTVFLDRDLCVRRFTPSAQIAIPLRDQDGGRSITELTSSLVDTDLGELAESVLKSGTAIERQVRTIEDIPIHLRVHPYFHSPGQISGAVITFVDLSVIDEAQRSTLERAKILRSIEETSRDVFWVIDADSLRLRYLSPSYDRVWGQPSGERLAESAAWLGSLHADDRTRVEREYLATIREGKFAAEYRIVRPDGQTRWISDRAHGVIEEGGSRIIIGSAEDVTSRVQVEAEHRQSLELHRKACDHALVPMVIIDPDGVVVWGNEAMRRQVFGEASFGTRGNVVDLLERDEDQQLWKRSLEAARKSGSATANVSVKLPPGVMTPHEVDLVFVEGESDRPGFFVCQWLDLSDRLNRELELVSKAATLEHEADRDPLTNLLNRRGLERFLSRQLSAGERSGDPTVVILMDCDHFKKINDTMGHAAGDWTLQGVAQRLRESLRPTDVLARVGGDEFLVVLPGARLAEGVHVGEKLRRAVADEPMRYKGQDIAATVSVGVVTAPPTATTAEELIAMAGSMLAESKHVGRNRVAYASENGSDGSATEVEQTLADLLSGQLTVVAQTLNDVRSSAPVGYELFTRGRDPLATPDRFFDASRRANCLERLDRICLDRCLAHAKTLGPTSRIHVNLFPSTLLVDEGAEVARILERVEGKERFCIELSEQQFIGNSSRLRSYVDQYRSWGYRIALDDVGFGRTALETLIAIEPEVVKIDRALIRDVDRKTSARRSLERLISLLGRSDVELIAEGVERESQRVILEDMGIQRAQGFLWSRP